MFCALLSQSLYLRHLVFDGDERWTPSEGGRGLYDEMFGLKVRSHQKQNYFSRRPKRVSLLARPFTVFSP